MHSKTRIIAILFTILSLCCLLASCGASPDTYPTSQYNQVDIYGITVQTHTQPQVDINQSFQVTASIFSSPYSLESLYGVFVDQYPKKPGGTLLQLLQPPSYTKSTTTHARKFALCMDVALMVDDSSLVIDEQATPQIQEFTVAVDGTQPQSNSLETLTVNWNVTANTTYDNATVNRALHVDVAFAPKIACNLVNDSLLETSYHLVSSSNNVDTATSVTVVDPQLVLQEKLVEARRALALAIPPVLLSALLAWISGFFVWVKERFTGIEPPKKRPSTKRSRQRKKVSRRVVSCALVIALGVLLMTIGLLFTAFCPPTLTFFLSSIAVTLVGVALIALGAWFVRPEHNVFASLNAV